jgi:hypothetical protein
VADPTGVMAYLLDTPVVLGVVLCALMYGDYALTIVGARLYQQRMRQFTEVPSYELNPFWWGAVARGRLWHPRLLYAFALCAVFAVLPQCPKWIWGAMVGPSDPFLDALFRFFAGYCTVFAVAFLSRSALLNVAHLQAIVTAQRLLSPELLSGRTSLSWKFVYGRARIAYWGQALILGVVALLAPSLTTLGLALGPVLLVLNIRQMEIRAARLTAASAGGEPPSPEQAREPETDPALPAEPVDPS